jgi:hypothetical protein
MTSAVFETDRFRVHITGKAAWVEAKMGANWVFRNWHAVPVAGDCGDSNVLKAAVEHYEEQRRGDNSLRNALTGIRKGPPKQPAARPVIAQRKPERARKSSGHYGLRAPLRPPLMPPAAALGPDTRSN